MVTVVASQNLRNLAQLFGKGRDKLGSMQVMLPDLPPDERTPWVGALLGGWIARGLAPALVVRSDGAPPFVILVPAACGIHAERPLAQLVPRHEEHRAALAKVRPPSWEWYQPLTAYRQPPHAGRRPVPEDRFDPLVGPRTGSPRLDGVLHEMRDHQGDGRRGPERPDVPLPTHAVESDLREEVQRRKRSGGARRAAGRPCRATLARLTTTGRPRGVRLGESLPERVRGVGQVPRRATLLRRKAPEAAATEVVAVPACRSRRRARVQGDGQHPPGRPPLRPSRS